MLNPAAQAGIFSYGRRRDQRAGSSRPRNGQIATVDPTIGKLLARHPLGDRHDGVARRHRRQPAALHLQRPGGVDAALPDAPRGLQPHEQSPRVTCTYNYQKFTDYPDTLNNFDASFPGFPVAAGQASIRMGCQQRHALDARPQPGERGARRLQQRAGEVLRRAEPRTCSPAASPISRATRSSFRVSARELTERRPQPGAAVAQRHEPPDRGHGDPAEGLAHLDDGRVVHAVRHLGE